jgi:tetratricopeptide (TPR) repeat protein
MRRRLLLPLLLLTAVFAAYYPALKAGYTNWDDPDYTFNNPVAALRPAAAVAAAFTGLRVGHYHPLTDLELAAEGALFGEKAPVRHAAGLLLHAANSALVFLLLAELLGSDLAALAGALLWALHPANAESAVWISERKNLLYAFFYLLALLAYLRRLSGRGGPGPVFALFGLALLCKASAVTLPFALLALDWLKGRPLDRKNLLEKAGLLALALGFTLAAAVAQGRQGALLAARGASLFSFYAAKAVWPLRLSALYPYRETLAAFRASPLLYGLPAAVFAGLLAAAVRRGRRLEAFGLLFFLVNILPFALIVPIGPAMAADRYLYVPLIGLALAVSAAAGPLLATRRARAAAGCVLLACLAAFAALTWRRARVWESGETLWSDVLARYPASETANLNMAQALLQKGDWPRAQEYLNTVLRLNPDNPDALYDLGTALAMAGRPAEALPLLEKSVRVKPAAAPAWNNLGLTFAALGRRAEARRAFLAACAADPAYAPARANLAAAASPAPGAVPARR